MSSRGITLSRPSVVLEISSVNLQRGQDLTVMADIHGAVQQIEVRVNIDGTVEIWCLRDQVQIKDWSTDIWEPMVFPHRETPR